VLSVGAVVPAAGTGERLGAGMPKALMPLGGVPLLVHALRALATCSRLEHVVIAVPPGTQSQVRALLTDVDGPIPLLVDGGATRADSVARCLELLPADVDVVLVHDAARPLVSRALVDRVVDAVAAGAEAVVPAVPVPDTIRQVDAAGLVIGTPSRDSLRAVQTPQGFAATVVRQAYRQYLSSPVPADGPTDDAGLVERLGVKIHVVDGERTAFKVTTPMDLLLAEAVLSRSRSRSRGTELPADSG
jgi:2-C-methyl-D-erythritol 4-phosphate cytidylyltransferase